MIRELSIFKDAHERDYAKGQILLYQGETSQDIYCLREGYVKAYDVTAAGAEKLIMILGPGDLFPIVWSFKETDKTHYFYEAFTDIKVGVIPRRLLLRSIDVDHKLTKHLLQYFLTRTQQLLLRLESIEATSARHKVGQVLSYLATTHGKKTKLRQYRVKVPVTHQAIANMAGITRETASLQLKVLETDKVFTIRGDELIINKDKLENFLNTAE